MGPCYELFYIVAVVTLPTIITMPHKNFIIHVYVYVLDIRHITVVCWVSCPEGDQCLLCYQWKLILPLVMSMIGGPLEMTQTAAHKS